MGAGRERTRTWKGRARSLSRPPPARQAPAHPWPGKMRYSGAFVVDAMWVVRQRFRGLVGVKGRIYDIAASALIASEVGIQIGYADGTPMDFEHLKDGKPIGRAYAFLPGGADLRFPGAS